MEEQSLQLVSKNRLNVVTTFSKHFALALFIVMPFIGGFVGYTYAPIKIVEVDRVVLQKDVDKIEVDVATTSKPEIPKFRYKPVPIEIPYVPEPYGGYVKHQSPNGNYIAWSYSNEGGDSAIYITDANENKLTEIYCGFFRSWSDDSTEIEVYVPAECGLPSQVTSASFYLTTEGGLILTQ